MHGEKYTKFFLNLKKKCGVQNQVREKEITDPKEISNNIKVFYETLFKQNSSKTKELETKIQNKNSLILYTIKH